ncbi:DUF1571 domain-containing protein [Schlesneria sp. T3-172]|uniref:DUF1571 domain-containing protein n=1 Tax=Schlesneria TaxID=656899 RepID=UPI002F190D18
MSYVSGYAMRLVGCLALGAGGLYVFGSILPLPLTSHPIVARKPLLPAIEQDLSSAAPADVAQDGGGDGTASPILAEESAESSATSTLRRKIELLDRGLAWLQQLKDYTVTLQKQEVVNGVLLDEQTISIKCRHNPFSVYLAWHSGFAGREVIYVQGQNSGNMVVHEGGWKSRIPALSLPTDGLLAMRDARYPVTMAGLMGLIEIMRGVHANDLASANYVSCEVDEHRQFDGRPCSMFTTRYQSRIGSPVYRKSITLIDHEWSVPLHSRHFEWLNSGAVMDEEQLDEATLIECYSFTGLNIDCGLTDFDFDRTNPEYQFR